MSGDAEILGSGSVILYDFSPIRITIGDVSTNLELVIEFNNTDTKEPMIETSEVENNRLKLILSNFNNPLGAGTLKSIPIGTWEDKVMSFSFRVYSDQKTLDYTFYKHE